MAAIRNWQAETLAEGLSDVPEVVVINDRMIQGVMRPHISPEPHDKMHPRKRRSPSSWSVDNYTELQPAG